MSPRSAAYSGYCAGGDAGALDDAGLVVERVVGHAAPVVEHLDVRVVDELVRVAVAGDDDDVDALRRRPASASVAITSSASTPSICERRDASASSTSWISGSCGTNRSGVSLRPALYVGVELVAERAARRVEHHRDVVGLLVGEHLHQHRREPVDRVGDRAVGRGEVGGQRVEGAVRERLPVEQEQLRCIVRRRSP